jgi:Glycosyltransferase family 87
VTTTATLEPTGPPDVPLRPDRGTLTRLASWYVVSRVVVMGAVLGGWTLRPDLSLFALLRRLDASWYLDIARFGYAAQAATTAAVEAEGAAVLRGAFSPLWPSLVRIVRAPGVPLEISATLLAMLLGFGVVVGSWVLVARLTNRDSADRAALLVAFFPGSVVFSIAYAEALMLCLVVGCLLALQERRWAVAGLLAALATAARPNALALVPACAWTAVVAIRRDADWRSVIAPALAPLGAIVFHGFLWWRTGRMDAWQLIQRNGWDEQVDLGVHNAQRLGALVRWSDPDPGTVLLGLGVIVVALGAWALWRWRPPGALSVYAAGVIGLAVIARTLGPRPRFVLTALPLLWALAVWLRGERFRAVLLASSGGLAVVAVLYIVGSVAKL